jgi:hypothetical protein
MPADLNADLAETISVLSAIPITIGTALSAGKDLNSQNNILLGSISVSIFNY